MIIKIFTQNKDDGFCESTVIPDSTQISEIQSRYQKPQPPGEEEVLQDAIGGDASDEVEFLYLNGERKTIDMAQPTTFQILKHGSVHSETHTVVEFEKAFIDASIDEDASKDA